VESHFIGWQLSWRPPERSAPTLKIRWTKAAAIGGLRSQQTAVAPEYTATTRAMHQQYILIACCLAVQRAEVAAGMLVPGKLASQHLRTYAWFNYLADFPRLPLADCSHSVIQHWDGVTCLERSYTK
jgi:hypothetical protein